MGRTPVRLAAAWAWILTFATVVISGYWIELHTTFFGAGDPMAAGATNDGIFTWLHQDVGLFLLPTVLVIMLAVERPVVRRVQRNEKGWTAMAGTTLLFIGGIVWVFIDPALSGTGFLVSRAGVLVTGLALSAPSGMPGYQESPASTTPTLSSHRGRTRCTDQRHQ